MRHRSRTAPRLVVWTVLAVAASRTSGSSAAAPDLATADDTSVSTRTGDVTRPSILKLSAPQHVQVGSRFTVRIAAADPAGLDGVELVFQGEATRLDARGERSVLFSVVLDANQALLSPIEATAIRRDGSRSKTASVAVAVAVSDAPQPGPPSPTPPPASDESFARRHADRGYAPRTGFRGVSKGLPIPGPGDIGVADQPWWQRWQEEGDGKPFDWKKKCGDWIAGIGPFGEVLRCWLDLHPKVAQSLVWQEVDYATEQVQTLAYPDWPEDQKILLDVAVFYAWEWLDSGLDWFNGEYVKDPPDNQFPVTDDNAFATGFTREAAWKLYLGTVGHSLALEIGGFVPWSIVKYSADDLAVLLDSREFFSAGPHDWYSQDDVSHHWLGYRLKPWVIPAPPTTSFEFLVSRDVIRPNHQQTVERLVLWGSDHMLHYGGGWDAENVWAYWQYLGNTPASRIMEGTTYKDPNSSFTNGPHGWTPGCHGASYFFQVLLRTANVPVQYYYMPSCGHGVPIFWTIGKTLSHGDDVYDAMESTPHFKASMLLISTATFDEWLVGPDADCKNVGRRVIEVALKTLPDALLSLMYCVDEKNGVSHAAGKVYELFKPHYSLAQLEAMNLWAKLAKKAAQLGSCDWLD